LKELKRKKLYNMKTKQDYKEDPLNKYINAEDIEKAPVGFTAKVMSGIRVETSSLKASVKLRNRNIVPAISIAFTLILITAAILMPYDKNDTVAQPVTDFLKGILNHVPKIDFSVLSFNLPATLIYISVAILMLTLFDRVLNGVFHRER
jgi:hypothetical protein